MEWAMGVELPWLKLLLFFSKLHQMNLKILQDLNNDIKLINYCLIFATLLSI